MRVCLSVCPPVCVSGRIHKAVRERQQNTWMCESGRRYVREYEGGLKTGRETVKVKVRIWRDVPRI